MSQMLNNCFLYLFRMNQSAFLVTHKIYLRAPRHSFLARIMRFVSFQSVRCGMEQHRPIRHWTSSTTTVPSINQLGLWPSSKQLRMCGHRRTTTMIHHAPGNWTFQFNCSSCVGLLSFIIIRPIIAVIVNEFHRNARPQQLQAGPLTSLAEYETESMHNGYNVYSRPTRQ